jgi:hypothetical protein
MNENDKVTVGEFEIVPNKIIIKLETSLDGFKKLCAFGLDKIKEVWYRDYKFYFIYDPDIAGSFINSTWGDDDLKLVFLNPLEITFLTKQYRYLRKIYMYNAILRLKEIAEDGTLIVEAGGR